MVCQNYEHPVSNIQNRESKRAVSLILVILIISTLLTAAVAVSDMVIRHAQATKGIEFSELAYFAAESSTEKTAYKVFKEYCLVTNCGTSGSLWTDGPTYTINAADIAIGSFSSPWLATVPAGRAFQISLDFNGASYPSSINVSQAGSQPSDLSVWKCTINGSDPKICNSSFASSQTFYPTVPTTPQSQLINMSDNNDYYYKIRINNRGADPETYSLSFTGTLPIDLRINEAAGQYKTYTRKIRSVSPHFPKYQIFSP